MGVLREFRDFTQRGYVMQIAIGVALAQLFVSLIESFVVTIVMPVAGLPFDELTFGALTWEVGDTYLLYGAFLGTVSVVVLALALIFFFVVEPYDTLLDRRDEGEDVSVPEAEEVALLREIARGSQASS